MLGSVLYVCCMKKFQPPSKNVKGGVSGGGEENRTPVRKPLTEAFYECSRCFNIPSKAHPNGRFA